MKKHIIFALGLALCLSLCACGNEEPKQIGGQVQNITTGSTEDTSSTDQSTANTNTATAAKGYVFAYNNVDIVVDGDVNDAVNKLGDADSYYEAPSCAFNGIEKTYTYNGFEICTYEDGDVDRIASVILRNDLVETKEGVCIGNDASAVEAAYGEPTAKEENSISYVKDGVNLLFITEDGKVVQIEYNTLVEQ